MLFDDGLTQLYATLPSAIEEQKREYIGLRDTGHDHTYSRSHAITHADSGVTTYSQMPNEGFVCRRFLVGGDSGAEVNYRSDVRVGRTDCSPSEVQHCMLSRNVVDFTPSEGAALPRVFLRSVRRSDYL